MEPGYDRVLKVMTTTDDLLRQLVAQQSLILSELEYVRENTRGILTGGAPDSGWNIFQAGQDLTGSLPGLSNSNLIPCGSISILNDEDTVGQFMLVTLVTDNPYVTLSLNMRTPENTWNDKLALSPYILNLAGLDFYNDRVPFLTKYDTNNNIYAVAWMPNLQLGYHHGVIGKLTNVLSNPVTGAANNTATISEILVIRLEYTGAQNTLTDAAINAVSRGTNTVEKLLNSLKQIQSLKQVSSLI